MEYCSKGDLASVLKKYRINWSQAVSICQQLTVGITCLHSQVPPIIHRDIKTLNILVTQNGDMRICDLASALSKSRSDQPNSVIGTLTYAAPERCIKETKHEPATRQHDIFSLAIVFWEIFNCVVQGKYSKPYSDRKLQSFGLMMKVSKGLRPTIPPDFPYPLLDLLKR